MSPPPPPNPGLLFLFLLFLAGCAAPAASTCQSSCGGIPLTFPFGGSACGGNPLFDPYLNCSRGRLFFHTPTGRYPVASIDYQNNVMVVTDTRMATCATGGADNGASFGLQVGAPFAFAGFNEVALLGCASTTALIARHTCDPSKQGICSSLYASCPSISSPSSLRTSIATSSSPVTVANSDSTCCVLSQLSLTTAPYDINLPLLQCSAFVSVYHIGVAHDPLNTWLYGIALQFYPGARPGGGSDGDHPSCYVCEEALDSGGTMAATPIGRLWSLALLAAAVLVGGAGVRARV